MTIPELKKLCEMAIKAKPNDYKSDWNFEQRFDPAFVMKLLEAHEVMAKALDKIQTGMGPDSGCDEEDWDGIGNADLREAVFERFSIARAALAKVAALMGGGE